MRSEDLIRSLNRASTSIRDGPLPALPKGSRCLHSAGSVPASLPGVCGKETGTEAGATKAARFVLVGVMDLADHHGTGTRNGST